MAPKISIVTVCYNAVHTIEQTILSVSNQTYQNIEYIIIDGGSTDGTVEIIKRYESHFSYWISESDKGIYDAMNKGIKKTSGDWVIFMNSGDLFVDKTVLENVFLRDSHSNSEVLVLYGSYKKFNNNIISNEIKPLNIRTLKYKMPFCHQSTFVKGEILKKYLFDSSLRIAADFKFFNSIYKKYGEKAFQYINVCIALFDTKDSMSLQNINIGRKEYIKIRGVRGVLQWIIGKAKTNNNQSISFY